MWSKMKQAVKPYVEKFPALAEGYRTMRDGWQANRNPLDTPMGFKLVGNAAMQKGSFEPIETGVVKGFLENADVFVNAGANIGYYCCHALSIGKHVIAFEPAPLNVHYLLKNISANGWESRAEVFPIAVSDGVGIVKLYGGGTGASLVPGWAGRAKQKATLVPASSFDVVLGARLSGKRTFILVDVEGAEWGLLKGARNILSSEQKPIWMIEITVVGNFPGGERNPHFMESFELFWGAGYEAYGLEAHSAALVPLSRERVSAIWNGSEKTPLSPNFIFAPKGHRFDSSNRHA